MDALFILKQIFLTGEITIRLSVRLKAKSAQHSYGVCDTDDGGRLPRDDGGGLQ